MSDMQDKFDAKLRACFDVAGADRDRIEVFKKLVRQDPTAAAVAVSKLVPDFMERYATLASESYGVDIARQGWKEQAKQKQLSDVKAGLLLMAANYYVLFSWCKTKLDAITGDESLPDHERAVSVCKVGVEALRGLEAVFFHNVQELRSRTSGEAAKFVEDELARRLAGTLATRISTTRNKRLAKALDSIREHKKPASRERFECLLRELYVLAPESWADYHANDWQLQVTRNAAVKKIEKRQTPQAEEAELATFADQQQLLKRGREVGLPPREYELLKLLVQKPKMSSYEAAQKLGITPGGVRALKSKINKTIGAA